MHIDTVRRSERLKIAGTGLNVGASRANRLLLIDLSNDEPHELSDYLECRGYQIIRVSSAGCIRDDDETLLETFAAVVLIVRLPDAKALSAIRQLNSFDAPPLLVVALEGETVERVLAIEMGADDLVGREIEPREVLSRLQRLIRRGQETDVYPQPRTADDWALKPSHRTLITPSGCSIKLTAQDQALLYAFAENTDGLLLDWQYKQGHTRTAISRLKRKVMAGAGVPLPILNVRGRGYRFDANLVQT